MNTSNSSLNLGNGTVDAEENLLVSISPDAYESFVSVSNIITPIICVAGLIGNGLGIGVLWSDTKHQKLTIYMYMFALTLFDAMYLFLGLLRSVPHVIKLYDEHMASYLNEHMKLGTIYVDMVLSHTATAIIIVMSLERFLVFVFPFTMKHMKVVKHPKRIIIACFLFNVTFLLPFPLFFEIGSYDSNNRTEYFIRFQESHEHTMNAYMICQTIVDYFIPNAFMFGTNIAIPIMYARTVTRRQRALNMSAQDVNSKQTKITLTVFCITFTYVMLSLPNLFIKMMAFIDKEYSFDGKQKFMFWLFIDISNLFTYINAANDFIIYILVSDHYRKVFVMMFCRTCRCRQQEMENDFNLDLPKSCSSVTDRF